MSVHGSKANLSLEVVIIAVICLLVLIVLTLIFAGRMGSWNTGMKRCDTICVATAEECTAKGYDMPIYQDSCQDANGGSIKGPAYCCREKTKAS
jgi:hypothetical protein